MSLSHALGSFDSDIFFREYWEKNVLHIGTDSADRFDPISQELDLNKIIWRSCREWGDVSLAKSNASYQDVSYGQNDPCFETIISAYSEGYTVVINNMQTKVESIATYCRAIENDLFCRVTANLYLTQTESQGLNSHYDDDDVFVLQLAGKKKWKIYDSSEFLPLRDAPYVEPTNSHRLVNEYTLNKGDFLYVPRGVVHDARSFEEPSLHLTISLRTITWYELLSKHLETSATNIDRFRNSIPITAAKHGNFADDEIEELRLQVSKIDHKSILDALDQCRQLLLKNLDSIPPTTTALLSTDTGEEQSLISKYQFNCDLIYALDARSDGVYLTVPEGILTFEFKYKNALEFVLRRNVFQASQIPDIDSSACEIFVDHLLKHNVIKTVIT